MLENTAFRYGMVLLPLLVNMIPMVMLLRWKTTGWDCATKGLLIGILLPFLIFNITALFHVNELIWQWPSFGQYGR